MGDGGMSIGTGFLVVFLILAIGAIGVLYGRCWERKAAAKGEGERKTSLEKLGQSAKDLTTIDMQTVQKSGRRSTLSMPNVDKKKGKPNAAPPRPPARKQTAPKRPPPFNKSNYAAEV